MGFKWVNGRLVDTNAPTGQTDLMASLLDRRERLAEATREDRSLFDKTIGAVVRAPGISQFLDVISRPGYAVQEAYASAIDPNKRGGTMGSALDAAVGAGRGIWGTKKTSGVDTLRDRGKEGALYTALGIGADIALDPTTYFGAAPLKAAGGAKKLSSGAKASAEVFEQARHVDDIKRFEYVTDPAEKIQVKLRSNLDRINEGKRPLRGEELTKDITKRLDDLAEERALKKINEIGEAYNLAQRTRTPKSVARKEVLALERARIKHGLGPYTTKMRNAKLNEIATNEALSMARAAQAAAEGAVEVKRAGLKLRFGKLSTEIRADSPGVRAIVDNPRARNTASKIVNSSLVQDLNKKFRTEGTYGIFNETRKLKSANGVASFYDIKGAPVEIANGLSVDDILRGLTEKEADALYHAFELGDLSQVPDTFKSGLTRDDVVSLAKYHLDDIWNTELDEGIIPRLRDENGNLVPDEVTGRPLPAVPKVENYMHHRVLKGQAKAESLKNKKAYTRAVAKDTFEPGVERTFKTAREAKDKFGIEIDTNFGRALTNRIAKHTQAMARKNFLMDGVKNFGITINDSKTLKQMKADGHDLVNLKRVLADPKKGAALDYLDDNIYVPRDIADKLKGIQTIANDPGPFLQLMDKFTRRWKAAATVYNPGHHVRNTTGDIFLGYVDGARSINDYTRAIDIVVDKNLKGFVNAGKGAGKLRKDQVVKLFHETGASPNFIDSEIPNLKANKLGRGVRKFSEGREEVVRMAHFFSAFREEMASVVHKGEVSQEVIDAAQRASQRVKKWHVDYADLTDFEKIVMKRIIPFYTWMRKSTPLMVEAMVLRPGKVVNFDRTFNGMFEMLGVESEDMIPQDLIPDWIKEQAFGQLGTSSRGNPLFMTPSMPYAEPFGWTNEGYSGALRQGLSSLNPVMKAPIELGLGRSTFTGAPIQEGVGQYATDLIPSTRLLSGIIKGQDPDRDTGHTDLINWLTGLGIREISPSAQRGVVRKQIDMLEGKLAEQGKEYPYKASTAAPSSVFVWENGKLVRKSR